jgi:hypothetical protein
MQVQIPRRHRAAVNTDTGINTLSIIAIRAIVKLRKDCIECPGSFSEDLAYAAFQYYGQCYNFIPIRSGVCGNKNPPVPL